MARKVQVSSPGKGGVKHDIKKPIQKKKPTVIERMKSEVRSSPRSSTRKVLTDIKNDVLNSKNDDTTEKNYIIKSETIKVETKTEQEDYDPRFEGMCEYEKIRLQNILERQAMFDSLEINDAKIDLDGLTPSRNKHTPSSRGLASEKKPKVILPPRKSARLAGGLVAEIDRFVPLVEEPEEYRIASLEDLGIQDTFNNADDDDFVVKTKELLSNVGKGSNQKSRISFESSVEGSLKKLSITDDLVAKVVPDRIFSVKLHPGEDKLLCAVGGKEGHVGLWDIMTRDKRYNDGVHVFQPHSRPINTLSWDWSDTSKLVTTSYDGTSRVLDCEQHTWQMLYGDKEYLEYGGWTSCHAQQSENTFLISQGNTGTVVLVDRRVGWSSPAAQLKCFDRLNPKSLSVHPVQSNLFLTGTNKAGCFIFDIRTATEKSLIKPVSELLGHTRSLSSCVFSRVTGDQVATLASDDKLRLYNTSTMKTTITPQCSVKHNNQTGRWLTPLRLAWHPTKEGMLVSGSMMRPRQMEVWSTDGGDLRMSGQLVGDQLGSVTSIVDIHPSRDVVCGGNSSGRCHVFM